MKKIFNLFTKSPSKSQINYKTEVLSGLTVALALVPEAVAFAFIAGLSPLTGLYAAFMMGLVTSILGGRPGMISGATGAVAVVLVALVKTHGVEYVFATVILAGILQILAGSCRLGKLIRLVPHPVIFGFVNGLAVVIFSAQLAQFQDASGEWLQGFAMYSFMGLVLLTMAIIWLLPKFTKAIPASLASILIIFALVSLFEMDTKVVGDLASIQGGFPPFHIPDVNFSLDTLKVIFPYAAIVAGVGLIESLLTLNIVDEITETHGKSNKEAIAQGTANILSGLFSGMGGCAMIGQSLINVSSGARTRISGIVASIMLLMFVMFGSDLIEKVPMAALTGLMIMVAIGTFEWASLRVFTKFPKSDILVMVLVTLVTIFLHNLALAVVVGVIIAALVFAWDNAKHIRINKTTEGDTDYYEVNGPLFFASTTKFLEQFDIYDSQKNIVIDFKNSRVADMSAIETLNKLTERYRKVNKTVHLKHLSTDCKTLIKNADSVIDVNVIEDPTYKVMLND